MSQSTARNRKKSDGGDKRAASDRIALAAIGLEAEFAVVVDGEQLRPEDVFGSPRRIIRGPLMHRVGRSYHLPTGGAVYFDTGVIEVATPVIEIEKGCAARAGRSLWESILFLRDELDAWEKANGSRVQLTGFSAHYNISFDLPAREQGNGRSVEQLALLLSYILPMPVMLLAANRESTGIGVRPRGNRIEVTADFTPSASLMIATATLIVGIVRAVMRWESFELEMLEKKGLPVLENFRPIRHTSRMGWLARFSCFSENPFTCDVDAAMWPTRDGRVLALRHIAELTARRFWPSIRRVSDPFTLRLIASVLHGRVPSLLDLDERPAEYEDIGRLCRWDNLFPERALPRSRYERVLIRAIRGEELHMNGMWYKPTGMKGWSRVVFRRREDGTRHVFSLDYLLDHLPAWERLNPIGKPRRPRRAWNRTKAESK
ncbi:MAG: hypothetical protein WEA80_08310 [Gemmatimonadaceae bacterium]